MKNKLIYIIIGIMLFSITATGCGDRIELENRAFVISMGVDKFDKEDKSIGINDDNPNDSTISITMDFPELNSIVNGDNGEDARIIKKADSRSITSAFNIVDNYSSNSLYFGHTKAVILGEEILKDEKLFKEILDGLERDVEISGTISVLSTDKKASEIIEAKIEGEPLVGTFISNFYRNTSNNVAITFPLSIRELIGELRSSGNTIIPKITLDNEQVKLGGGAIIKDFKLVGWLNDVELRSFLWFKGEAEGAELITKFMDTPVPLKINKNKIKYNFEEVDNHIVCNLETKAEGVITEFTMEKESIFNDEKIVELETIYENMINKEVIDVFNLFQNEYDVDSFNILDRIRKDNYDLYLKYHEDWENNFKKLEVVSSADVKIRNIGAIK